MSTKTNTRQSLMPTIGLAIGMLCGGVMGAGLGVLIGGEPAVVFLYGVGAIAGAATGAVVGRRWQRG